MENNDTSENGQGEQRPNEGTIIVGDSIVKGLRRGAAKQRVTVRSFPGATTADMEHYYKTRQDKTRQDKIYFTQLSFTGHLD